VNVQNSNDSKCFLWSVLSALYEPKLKLYQIRIRSGHDRHKLSRPNQTNISIRKAEPHHRHQHPLFRTRHQSFTVEYLSPERSRQHHINLLLLHDESETSKHQYVRVTNMSRLVAHRTKHDCPTYVCNSCLHPFSTPITLETHISYCHQHPPQQVQYPDPENCKLKFDNVKKTRTASFLPRRRLRVFPNAHRRRRR